MANGQSVANPGEVTLAVENPSVSDEPDVTRPGDPVGSVLPEPSDEQTTEDDTPTPEQPTTTKDIPPTSTSSSSAATPPPPPSSLPAPPSNPQVTEEEQVVTLVNAARARIGCEPVRIDVKLRKAAQSHSKDMADRDYFDHTTPEGVGFAERIVAAGFPNPGAENIARGQTSATQVMNGWMESDGHRANILNCQLTAIGVGLDKDGWYWTQNFGY